MRLPLGGFLVCGIISFSSAGVLAADTKTPFPSCTTAPTEADRKAAQGAFEAGRGSFNEADYATAITYWRDAYRRDCTAHDLLLNLARAYELKNDRAEAVNALETYLQRKPDSRDADQIRRRIENLKTQMAAAAPAPSAPPPAAPAATTPVVAPPTAESADKGHSAGPAPFILAGVGGAVAIVGTVLLITGKNSENDAATQCPIRDACNNSDVVDQGNSARAKETIGGAMLGVGGAAVVGGLIWYFASGPSTGTAQGANSHAGLAPAVGPGYAGFALRGRF